MKVLIKYFRKFLRYYKDATKIYANKFRIHYAAQTVRNVYNFQENTIKILNNFMKEFSTEFCD